MNVNKSIVLLVFSVLLTTGLLRFSFNNLDFSSFNDEWNGGNKITALISNNHTVEIIQSRNEILLFEPDISALVMLGPGDNFSEDDIITVRNFVNNGGLFILADDFGTGNIILSRFTSSVSFSGGLFIDEVDFRKNTSFPVAVTSIENAGRITLNYPVTLNITDNDNSVRILANSSQFSRLTIQDMEGSGYGPYPVIAEISSGAGELVIISDPSIFINSMLDFEDNKILLEKLLKNRTFVIFDETYRTPSVPAFISRVRKNIYSQVIITMLIISVALVYIKREKLSIFRKKKSYETDHMDMDEEKIISDIIRKNKWNERKFSIFRKKLKEGKL